MVFAIHRHDLIKLKSFCTMKETISKVKRQASEWETMIVNKTTDKELISKIYKQLMTLFSVANHSNKFNFSFVVSKLKLITKLFIIAILPLSIFFSVGCLEGKITLVIKFLFMYLFQTSKGSAIFCFY